MTEQPVMVETPHAAEHADDHHSPEAIKKEIRVYLIVFGALSVLTGLTVYACYGLKMPAHIAITIALIIACTKGFLVAGFFMHLLSEKKLIYSVLGLTVFFFAVLLWGPWHHFVDMIGK
ncbi:MAG TPA: cytochrome C oxidase subunit IV family protein [Thermoanaerobaculia bacterium]|nr:cytochrome C oxidase subunit IV family protein [Thermoanaerobaculia bacterium]